jgi:hypothetical protein
MLLWMGRALFTGEIPFTGDLLHFHYPLRDFYASALARGERFDWMPSLFNGFYVVGEGQLGAYHPLHWLLYRFLPLDRAFAIEMVAAYPFMFIGALWFLRRWMDGAPAAFGAMVLTFSGFTLSHGVHPNMVTVVAHLPWILLAIHHILAATTKRTRARGVAALGLLIGSQLLLGHPQAVWLSGLVAAAYAATLLVSAGARPRLPGAGAIALGVGLGVAIGAVQLAATYYAVQRSVRAAVGAAFTTTYSLAPVHLLQLLEPYVFWQRVLRWNEAPGAGDEFAAYGGAVTLTLAVWWLAGVILRRRDSRTVRDRLGIAAGILAVAGLWLATGSYGKLYYLQTWLPIVGQFRAPVRFVLLTHIALAVLAALAMAQLLAGVQKPEASPRRALRVPWSLAAASTAAAVWFAANGMAPAGFGFAVILGPLLFVTASAVLTMAVRGARWGVIALALLAAADHAAYGLGGVVVWHDFITRQQAVSLLDTPDSVLPDRGRLIHGAFPDLYLLGGYRFVDGYLGLVPSRQLDYDSPAALRLANAVYANAVTVEKAHLTEARPLARGWYELPAPLPRVRLVAENVVTNEPATAVAQVDVARFALTTHDLGLSGGTAGSATTTIDAPGRLQVETQAIGQQLLVVSESFDEGWIARIDGQPAAVERVNGDFLGVVVPAGSHTVALDFRPRHLTIGRWISAIGGVLGLLLVLGTWRADRR